MEVRERLTLVPHPAGENIQVAWQRAETLLKRLGLLEREGYFPDALDGGQRQRLAVARALMNDPQGTLTDELTASLDSGRGREVLDLSAHRVHDHGKAAVMVTREQRVLDLCDRGASIVNGSLRE